MRSEWKVAKIEDVAERVAMGPFGSSIKVSTFVEKGIPVISGQHLKGTRLEDSAYNFVTEDHADALKNANVRRGDVIFTHAGSIGQAAYIPKTSKYNRYVISQRQFFMRCDLAKVIPEFIAYYFRSHGGQHDLLANTSQTGVPSIARPVTYLRSIRIPLPPLPTQKRLAHILGTLDDKIELNRKMNETLEGMARALFQSWFVDFDPVRRNLDRATNGKSKLPTIGKPPSKDFQRLEKSAQKVPTLGKDPDADFQSLDPAALAELDALFPDSFEESELGPIPKGWTIEPVGQVIDCVGGGTPSTGELKYWNGGTHHWSTPKDLSSLQSPVLLDTDRKITDAGLAKVSSGLLPAGTLLMSSRAPVGYLAIAVMPVAINQGFIAMKCNERASEFFMLNWCRANMDEIKCRASGTTFAEISKKNFRTILIALPPQNIMGTFTTKMAPIYSQIAANLHQSRTLAALRDTLLPKLLSGEIEVGEAEREIEENI